MQLLPHRCAICTTSHEPVGLVVVVVVVVSGQRTMQSRNALRRHSAPFFFPKHTDDASNQQPPGTHGRGVVVTVVTQRARQLLKSRARHAAYRAPTPHSV